MRIVKLDRMRWQDRRHFFATGSRILRQAIVDEIRRKRSAKRQAPTILVEEAGSNPGLNVGALDAALQKLESGSPDLAKLVEMRFFARLGIIDAQQQVHLQRLRITGHRRAQKAAPADWPAPPSVPESLPRAGRPR